MTDNQQGSQAKKNFRACPNFVLEYLSKQYSDIQVTNVVELKSAQQQVLLLSVNYNPFDDYIDIADDDNNNDNHGTNSNHYFFNDNQKIVIRIWKAGAKWWNLHQNFKSLQEQQQSIQNIAKCEIFGYRIAHESFEQVLQKEEKQQSSHVYIPKVYYFYEGDDMKNKNDKNELGTNEKIQNNDIKNDIIIKVIPPWAIIQYVGPNSFLFSKNLLYDDSWTTGMIQFRKEYGFVEEHKRWGRVPEPLALQYAMIVLHQVTIPLHKYSCKLIKEKQQTSNDIEQFTFNIMVDRLKQIYKAQILTNLTAKNINENNQNYQTARKTLEKAFSLLQSTTTTAVNSSFKSSSFFVLVHLDLQPQNLLFGNQHTIVSVLDWEDAAIADPRFDLLLLCRKVCANREQANQVWKTYESEMNCKLGLIEPWLLLESTHCLCSSLLHSMNILSIERRNPWESNQDLWNKLQREFQRITILFDAIEVCHSNK